MIASIICILLFTYLIVKDNHQSRVLPPFSLYLLLFLKVIGAFGFYALYTYYYGNGVLSEDAGSFIREAELINQLHHDNFKGYCTLLFNLDGHEQIIEELFANYHYSRFAHPEEWINSTRNVIKVISLLLLFSGGSMFFVFVAFSAFSLISLYTFWKAFKQKHAPPFYLVFLFCLPSLLLWNSSILREVVGISGLLFLLTGYMLSALRSKTIFYVLGFLCLLFFKPIWFLIALFAFLVVLLRKAMRSVKIIWRVSSVIVILLIVLSGLPNALLKKTSDKQFDFINVAKGGIYLLDGQQTYRFDAKDSTRIEEKNNHWVLLSNTKSEAVPMGKEGNFTDTLLLAGKDDLNMIFQFDQPASQFDLKRINNQWDNLFKLIPAAYANVWLRPYPWENQSRVLIVGMGIENVLLLAMFLTVIFKMIQRKRADDLELYALTFVLLMTLAIGFVTPVTGAIVRYRIPIHLMTIVLFISLNIFEHKWLKNTSS